MRKFTSQLFPTCFILTATVLITACGGGGSNISPAPAVEPILVVKRFIGDGTNSAAREVALATNAGATIVAARVRCISYFAGRNAPPGNFVTQIQSKALLFDVSPTDAEKLKAIGFEVYSASDFEPLEFVPC